MHRRAGQSSERRVLIVGRIPRRWRAAAGDERGFTLTELLIAMTLGLIVIGASVMVFTAAVQSQPKTSARAAKVQQARTTAERITRELRQGWGAPTTTASQLAILTYVPHATCGGTTAGPATGCRVTYTCTAGACTRVEANADGTAPGPAETVVSGLSGSDVFSYISNSAGPTWIGITLAFPAGNGDDAITVEDGAALRNPAVTPP
jgi:prepilin-type N-terminal cleavage/methylation domain-containing protein